MKKLRVAVGVIQDASGKVLLTKRNKPGHLQGYWEFPGGKVDAGEAYKSALRRELLEELKIKIIVADKIFAFQYNYPDLLISFEVFRISAFEGEVIGAEQQEIEWLHVKDLSQRKLPPANAAILDALQLPRQYMIADYDVLQHSLVNVVEARLADGIKIIQLRANTLCKDDYLSLANQVLALCNNYQASFIANCAFPWLENFAAKKIHLNSSQLKEVVDKKNLPEELQVFSVACHDEIEIEQANIVGARCILLGAVNQTESHPTSRPMGWNRFAQLCCLANQPVYVLGGVGKHDIPTALAFGAQGVAGIRDFIED